MEKVNRASAKAVQILRLPADLDPCKKKVKEIPQNSLFEPLVCLLNCEETMVQEAQSLLELSQNGAVPYAMDEGLLLRITTGTGRISHHTTVLKHG